MRAVTTVAPSEVEALDDARARRARLLRLGAGVAAATAAIGVMDPVHRHVPLCPLKAVTGLDCPFCGGLRAVWSLLHGRIGEAADHNLLFTVAAPFLVAGWVWWLVAASTGRPKPTVPRWVTPVFLVVAVVFTVLRNLPAFAWLGSGVS